MKTKDIKDYLTDLFTRRGEWKRRKKEKVGGSVMREFENTLKYKGMRFVVNTGPDDDRIHSIILTMPEPPEVKEPDPEDDREPKAASLDELSRGYYYQLEYVKGNPDYEFVVGDYVLTIGSQPRYMDDHRGPAQKSLDVMLKQINGKDAYDIELAEGMFELTKGEAAKLKPMLAAAGWQKGQW